MTQTGETQLLAGRFKILERLGTGGQASVYLAFDPKYKIKVAVKLYKDLSQKSESSKSCVLEEILQLTKLHSPHVVNVYEGFMFEDTVYIVMEVVDGETLSFIIENQFKHNFAKRLFDFFKQDEVKEDIKECQNNQQFQKYINTQVRSIIQPEEHSEPRRFRPTYMHNFKNYDTFMHCMVSQLLSMLRYLQNEHSIMHRDIKPSNIMITPHSILKLIDFGLSFSGMLTKGYCGTRGYIAPEIIKNVSYTKKCDIFSVGAVIFEIVSGYPPIINSKSNSLESHIYENQFILPPNLFWADVGFYQRYLDLAYYMMNFDPISRPDIDQVMEYYRECRADENMHENSTPISRTSLFSRNSPRNSVVTRSSVAPRGSTIDQHGPVGQTKQMDLQIVSQTTLKDMHQDVLKKTRKFKILISGLEVHLLDKLKEYNNSYQIFNQRYLIQTEIVECFELDQGANQIFKDVNIVVVFQLQDQSDESLMKQIQIKMLRFNGRKHEYLMKTVEIVQFESTFQIDRLEINNELSHFDVKSLFIFLVGLGIKEHIFQLEDLSQLRETQIVMDDLRDGVSRPDLGNINTVADDHACGQ